MRYEVDTQQENITILDNTPQRDVEAYVATVFNGSPLEHYALLRKPDGHRKSNAMMVPLLNYHESSQPK